jgi:ATP-dependent Zn protease
MLPKEDENIITKKQLMEQVAGLMGGRAGEEVVVGDKSTGASNDFEQATNIARGMVTQYGMTDVGMTELESPSMQDLMELSHTVRLQLLRLMKLLKKFLMKVTNKQLISLRATVKLIRLLQKHCSSMKL